MRTKQTEKQYNAPSKDFSPEVLAEAAKIVEELREDMLFGIDAVGAELQAEQFYLLALASLEQAHRYLMLASVQQSRSLASNS